MAFAICEYDKYRLYSFSIGLTLMKDFISVKMKSLAQYSPELKKHSIRFAEQGNYLYSPGLHEKIQVKLHISARSIDTIPLLDLILPLLKSSNIPFRIVKSQFLQYQLNAGMFGPDEIGKVISFYPQNASIAISMAAEINKVTGMMKGPIVPCAKRIGEILYAQSDSANLLIDYPLQKKYAKDKKISATLGRSYIPIQLIKASYKGNIYKAVSLKKLCFKTCLIKEGKPVALDDQYEREMKDRLLWQRTVIQDLQDSVMTPSYLDYFEAKAHSYLVLQYADGQTLFQTVKDIYQDKNWNTLPDHKKKQLLTLFMEALNIVYTIHKKGYVQRDISDSNFLVLANNSLCIIDFELSYSMTRKEPKHPFLLGTFGYAAPEQLKYALPDYKEDIYSLGALLCFFLTNTPPIGFITSDHKKLGTELLKLTNDRNLNQMILSCLSTQRSDRPAIFNIKRSVSDYASQFK